MSCARLAGNALLAINSGDKVLAPGLKGLLQRACNIGKRRDRLKDATLLQYLASLAQQLTNLMTLANPHNKANSSRARLKSAEATWSCS